MMSTPGQTLPAGNCFPVSPFSKAPYAMYNKDVGVSRIISPTDTVVAFGDRAFPRGQVRNFGSKTQTNIAVICVIYDSAAGTRVYGPDTAFIANLDSGSTVTVAFSFWSPPTKKNVYFDTMATVLPGDEDTSNDWKAGRFTVSNWGEGRLTYNDGSFENAISWVQPGGELTERFAAPVRPLPLSKAVVWVTSFYKADYDAEVRVYANDGSPHGYPGTELGFWSGKLQTDTWMFFHKNEVTFDPPVVVDYDTFFVSYYQTSVTPAYCYLAMDTITDNVHIGNDWGRYVVTGRWDIFPYDYMMDFGLDAYYGAPLLDGSPKEVAAPSANIDSNTTFTPQVVVTNAGLLDRENIPVRFSIVQSSALGDTIYADSANTGPIAAGQEVTVTFSGSVTPPPGYYTMTSITSLPYDAKPRSDTLVEPLAVGRPGIAGERTPVGRASFTIAPNPLTRTATVRYALPGAGLVTLDVYGATGQKVLSQTIAAGRVGTTSLDLRKLEAGVYIVKVNAGDFSSTQKLVVQHQ
jgi:hypothetical protein